MEQSERDSDPPQSPQDMSSFDDESYSGSDLDDDSFASESSDDGIVAQDDYKKKKSNVAAKEHQRVFRARIFVLALLAITAVSNSVIVYFLTLNKEQKDYDHHVS